MSDNRLGEYLRARREQARPEDFGLADLGRRRVPGLRREELAMLAGISADYYVRLERGRDRHPSEQVLEALARVLGLDDDAAAYLAELARPTPPRRRRAVPPERVRPSVERLLQRWTDTPAFVLGQFMDVLAYNELAGALHSGFAHERNMVRVLFLDPASRDVYPDWDDAALEAVATLRAAAVSNLDHPRLTELVGELSLKSAGVPPAVVAPRRARQDRRLQADRAPDGGRVDGGLGDVRGQQCARAVARGVPG